MDNSRTDCIAPDACKATGAGHCRMCRKIYLNNHPEVRAKMSAASKKAWADPEVRAKMSAARKKAWADRLSWCPPQLLEEYRFLVSKLGKAEAREIIERQSAKRAEAA